MSIGEHDTCPYCGHSNLIISKNDAAVKALVEAAKAMLSIFEESDSECSACRHAFAGCDGDREGCLIELSMKKALKALEGL